MYLGTFRVILCQDSLTYHLAYVSDIVTVPTFNRTFFIFSSKGKPGPRDRKSASCNSGHRSVALINIAEGRRNCSAMIGARALTVPIHETNLLTGAERPDSPTRETWY